MKQAFKLDRHMSAAALVLATVLASACGGGSSSESSTGVTKPSERTQTQQLDHLSDRDIQLAAASGGKQMGTGIGNLQRMAGDSDALDTVDDSEQGAAVSQVLQGDSIWAAQNMDGLMDASLGLQGNADVERSGDSVLIDPDDAELCDHELLASDASFIERQFCLQMVADLRVRVDADSDDAGTVTYLYQDETVLVIDYTPNSSRFKLRLDGALLIMQKANALAPQEFENIPEVFSGVVEMYSELTNDTLGQEAGMQSVSITAPIAIQDDLNQFSLQLAASDLLQVEMDAAAGTASVEVDARTFAMSFMDGSFYELMSPGSSVRIDLVDNGDQISVSKLGLGNGPLTVSIDSIEAIRLSLDTFGFDLDGTSGQLTLTDNLNFGLAANLLSSYFDDDPVVSNLEVNVNASAPGGSRFTPTADLSSVRLDQAGPLALDWMFAADGQVISGNFLASEGQCFGPAADGSSPVALVACP